MNSLSLLGHLGNELGNTAAPTGGVSLGQMGSIALLLLIDAFFVAAAFAVVSMRRSRVQQWVADGDPAAVIASPVVQQAYLGINPQEEEAA